MKQKQSKIGYNPHIKISNTIENEFSNKTIKQYLRLKLKFSTELTKRAKYNGQILLNGEQKRVDAVLNNGDNLVISIPEYRNCPCKPFPFELDIVYEDANILIINKPAPLPCLCGPNDTANTLQNAIYSYFAKPDYFLFRPLNRLDCGTSGLMLIAKNAYIQSYLQAKLHSDEFKREYIAIVENFNLEEKGIINNAITRISNNMYGVSSDGKACKTEYRLLEKHNNNAMLLVKLHSGRTHQIRVHFSSLGSPIIGDYVYGKKNNYLKDRFALHSYSMDIKLPYFDEPLHLEADIPKEILKVF